MSLTPHYDALFSGVIGKEYEMLKLICPFMTEMSRLVAESVKNFPGKQAELNIVEIGGGTGITTLALLSVRDDSRIISIDNEPTMQNQAKQSLNPWVEQHRLSFNSLDALSALQAMPSDSADIVASAYTLHNFEDGYRKQVIKDIYRVLSPDGLFVNGDRYALDDVNQHTRMIQEEVSGYFKVLVEIDRLDLLEHWIVHLFSDESENHVMRETTALKQLQDIGFTNINLSHRMEVNALITAVKPQG